MESRFGQNYSVKSVNCVTDKFNNTHYTKILFLYCYTDDHFKNTGGKIKKNKTNMVTDLKVVRIIIDKSKCINGN